MRQKIFIIIFVIVMATISGGLLVGINIWTKTKIEKNKKLKSISSILDAFGIEYNKLNLEQIFNENIKIQTKNNLTFYQSKDGDIAFEFRGSGVWGPIYGFISLKKDLETIKGIQVTYQEETPGLGGRISEEAFLNQFRDKKIIPKIIILPSTKKATQINEVDGITGATMTSKAFEDILNKEAKKYLDILRE